jgi:signal transduction histidine kinase
MERAIAPLAGRLERRFRTCLRAYDVPQARALLAITPVAASRLRSIPRFLEQVDYNGRRLAKLNVPIAQIRGVLSQFSSVLDQALDGRFRPAREQLQMATVLALETAFHHVREAESQAFFSVYRAELESPDLPTLLDRFVRILTRTFGADAGRIMTDCRPGGKLAHPFYIRRGTRAEVLVAEGLRGRYACYWSYPLQSQAVIQFGFGVPYPWLPREIALLEAVGRRCLEAIERARLRAEIRRLEAAARHAEECERRRIGRELHDEAGQSLLLVRLQLEMIEREVPKPFRARLCEARATVENTIQGLRRIVAALSPAVLERLGLEAAIRQLVARFRKTHEAEYKVLISLNRKPVALEVQEVIYRVTQECLQNILKHSGATHVNLSLRSADKSIRLRVSDNGAGFSTEEAFAKPMSFGLAGMRERVALLGGTLTVRSRPGKGAAIAVELPRTPVQVALDVKNTRTPN